jgi:hypothetical protein
MSWRGERRTEAEYGAMNKTNEEEEDANHQKDRERNATRWHIEK